MSEERNLQEIYRLNCLIVNMEREWKLFVGYILLLLKCNSISREEIAKQIEKHLTS